MSENTVTTPMATEAAIAFLKEASRYFSKVGHNGEDAGFWAAQQNSINCLKIVALIEELSAQRMTGTPSKDRAGTRHAAYEILCRIDAPTDDKRIGIVAANLDKAFAEGMKRAAEHVESEGLGYAGLREGAILDRVHKAILAEISEAK